MTNKELEVMRQGILTADHRDGHDALAAVWVGCIQDFTSLRGKEISGVVSSLVQKGLVITDGEAIQLTEEGVALLKSLNDLDADEIEILNRDYN